MDATTHTRDEVFFKWATAEIEKALRIMRRDNVRIHAFDFDGTTGGVKEPWSIVILIAPKKDVSAIPWQDSKPL